MEGESWQGRPARHGQSAPPPANLHTTRPTKEFTKRGRPESNTALIRWPSAPLDDPGRALLSRAACYEADVIVRNNTVLNGAGPPAALPDKSAPPHGRRPTGRPDAPAALCPPTALATARLGPRRCSAAGAGRQLSPPGSCATPPPPSSSSRSRRGRRPHLCRTRRTSRR